jgi:3-hydroxyisobutyrate dehydrogenase-like beta-hydroxyacid dehydrogenase
MQTKLKVGVVGGLGLMSSPMARHWDADSPVQVVRVHDRGTPGERRDKCRAAWREHGAELVPNLADVASFEGADGVFVCSGKNGDDLPIIAKLTKELSRSDKRTFICHLSTLSARFVNSAKEFCAKHGVDYVNYPLTGGPMGAEKATMLILCSGDRDVYDRLLPALAKLGSPKFFGESPTAATEVKLIGQVMVFNGLIGICSAAALHSEIFQGGRVGGAQQGDFFDFLNAGAGGTRQWELFLSQGVRNETWDAPFFASYGAIDAIYAAHLAIERGTSYLTVRPLIDVSLAFSYVVNNVDPGLATHSIVREMVTKRSSKLDQFIRENSSAGASLSESLEMCIRSLSKDLQPKVALNIDVDDFE